MERQQWQLEELRRENADLRAQLAATRHGPAVGHAASFQHQPYALPSPAGAPVPHQLRCAELLSQDERVAAELAAAPSTPRGHAAVPGGAQPMDGPEEDSRGRTRDVGELTPE
eukprot:EG_transcript_57118